jgi:ataxia telangiectasia mutated family protein
MEQVFAEVTALLRKNKATQQRDLRIRTYNVVPLDATTGAVEFVQNTDPLMPILSSAHELYHPDELKWSTVRKYVVDAKANGASNEKRVKVFRDAIKRFTPVFRHIFLERYHEPDVWFARQTNYTRSTAANSILGHIIGLGDRHNANILLDKVTGEIVHIDIGVCFEAGRILPIPETVPFRLTRDIIDGFGVLGTEGVFRRCCEFMLGALRENKDTIMTLLNVLRYDPLHNWTVSPLRAVRLQKEQATADSTPAPTPVPVRNSGRRSLGAAAKVPAALVIPSSDVETGAARGNANEDEGGEADRALRVVEKKLGKLLSVEAAVNELIQQATDEANLALLFGGKSFVFQRSEEFYANHRTGWAAWA